MVKRSFCLMPFLLSNDHLKAQLMAKGRINLGPSLCCHIKTSPVKPVTVCLTVLPAHLC